MPDMVYIALIIGFFAATIGLVYVLDRLLRRNS